LRRVPALSVSGEAGGHKVHPLDTSWSMFRANALPGVDYAFFLPNPRDPGSSILVMSSLFDITKEDQLLRYLDLYTIWAVRPEWKEELFEAGHKAKLIKRLTVFGMEWAYSMFVDGWDHVLDALAKSGALTFEEAQ